jgi:hypothetical protein
MTMARRRNLPEREDVVEYVNGLPIAHRRVPLWLMVVIVGVIAWGLTYLITYSITDTGSFKAPGIIGGLLLR